MKKILSFLMVAVLAVMLGGCEKYDDTELRNRVGALESLTTYQSLLQKLQAGQTVTAYSKSGNDITLTFSDGSTVTFNQQGVPGESIQGPAGVTPQFKIEGTTWKVSYNDGKTWQDAGEAVEKSLFKDVKVNDAGDTLLITLADGTTIPVFYGEKEKFGFEIAGGRRCFSILESLASVQSKKMTIPYVLTGDITNPDDVDIETRVTSYQSSFDGYELVKVQKTDAKSGTISVRMLFDDKNDIWFGGEYTYVYPEMLVEVTAHFPDGTSSYKKLYIIGYQVYMETDEDQWDYAYVTDYDATSQLPAIHLPREAGEFTMIMRYGTASYTGEYFYEYYDGTPFETYPFADVFDQVRRFADNNGYFLTTTINPEPTVSSSTNWWGAEYRVQVKYTRNATGKERYNDLQFWLKESATSANVITRVRVFQAAE